MPVHLDLKRIDISSPNMSGPDIPSQGMNLQGMTLIRGSIMVVPNPDLEKREGASTVNKRGI